MKQLFGTLPSGEQAWIYTLRCGDLTAQVTDLGATLVSLQVPDRDGNPADVVLGYDKPEDYVRNDGCLGATVGRNANRVRNSSFTMNGQQVQLTPNEKNNNLHSGPSCFHTRVWRAKHISDTRICFVLESPQGDQGFPGNATIRTEYSLEPEGVLRISYSAVSDRDTVFNMTNHSYFNLAGQDHPELAMDQILTMPARVFTPDDEENIPTGELRQVEGTPMDFRVPKALGRDIEEDYECLKLQGGYDHNFEVFTEPCAILEDPHSGRTMCVVTDCPGIQIYTANFLDVIGKSGVHYGKRSGVAMETQYYPDSVNHPEWKQPFVKANTTYLSQTRYIFKAK